jgi:hypothetical protein
VVCLRWLGVRHHRGEEIIRAAPCETVSLPIDPGGPLDDLDSWLDGADVPDGAPCLVWALDYDIDLNRYFLRPGMIGAAQNTRLAAAGDRC